MTQPVRIQLRRKKGWRMPENTVKVDRSTPWGNPFITGKHGTRTRCVELYGYLMAGYLCLIENTEEQRAARQHVLDHHHELRGKNLACWCPLEDADGNRVPCHADVLLAIANSEDPS